MNACPHGKSYRSGCRCDACRAKVAKYMQDYRRRNAEKSWGKEFSTDLVSPEVATKLLWNAYTVQGMTFSEISRLTGINLGSVKTIFYQKHEYITRATEKKILDNLSAGTTPRRRKMATRQRVDSHKYVWVVYCLFAQGWTNDALDEFLRDHGQLDTSCFVRYATRGHLMYYETAQKILWLRDNVGDKQGPSTLNKKRMKARGIFPLIHYTDDGELLVDSLLPEQRRILEGL
jgi:hypothetical protein